MQYKQRMSWENLFSVQVFFLTFREVLESAIILSVLLSLLKRVFFTDDGAEPLSPESWRAYRLLRRQVWLGSLAGLVVCGAIGTVFIVVFRSIGKNLWNTTEKLWEAFFCIVASILITIMGRPLLRLNSLQKKWNQKLTQHLVEHHSLEVAEDEAVDDLVNSKSRLKRWSRKYALFLLPFVTTLREGLEAVTFLGGLGISVPSSSIPLSVMLAFVAGVLVGVAMYKYGTRHKRVQTVVLVFTCMLYLVAAGLFSRGVWFIEMDQFIRKVGSDVSESGSGPGSYNVHNRVWHVNCCNPEVDGPYIVLNGLLGWQNTATYGSIISYNLYWAFIIIVVARAMYKERQRSSKLASNDVEDEASQSLLDNSSDTGSVRNL